MELFNSLRLNLEFPVNAGSVYVHIWGKPAQLNETHDFTVEQQRDNLETYYKKHFAMHLHSLTQVHGKAIVTADPSLCSPEADCVITENPAMALAIKTADCIPVLFFHNQSRLWGAVHCGWRGLKLKLFSETLKKVTTMEENSKAALKKEDFRFIVGPHIFEKHYETQSDVYGQFSPEFSAETAVEKKRNLNLQKILKSEMAECGLDDKQIVCINDDTYLSDFFFSHRKGDKGRNFNVIFFVPA